MRELAARMSRSEWIGLNVEQFGCHVVMSVVSCVEEQLQVVTLCSVSCNAGWDLRLANWIADYWSVMVTDPVVLGGAYAVYPALGGLCQTDSIEKTICVSSLVLEDMTKLITRTVASAFGGQEIDVLVTFLATKLRDEIVDPVLVDCPILMRVSMELFLCVTSC